MSLAAAINNNRVLFSLFKRTIIIGSLVFALGILPSAIRAATIVVPPGGDLQAAIDTAQFGDTIILQAGATYQAGGAPYYSPFYLGSKSGGAGTDADYITIRSSNSASLPTGRVSPSDRGNMAKIVVLGPYGAFQFLNNARYWKLVGLEITNSSDGTQAHHVNTFVGLGGSGIAHSWIDRCYIHPQEDGTNALARTASHGIIISSALSGTPIYDTKITNNYISGFGGSYAHSPQVLIDAEAIGSNVLDTILVDNNFLSATYQPWFPGGADLTSNASSGSVQASPAPTLTSATLSNVANLNVGDYITFEQTPGIDSYACARIINISGNNLTFTALTRYYDPPEIPVAGRKAYWNGDIGRNYTVTHNTFDIDPVLAQAAYDATGSSPKGYMEWKMGENVLVEGNIFQGYPSVFAINAVNQTGATPWVTVSNFTFRNNWVKNFGTAFVFQLGNPSPSGLDSRMNAEGQNFLIENNLFTQNNALPGDRGATKIGGMGGGSGFIMRHNTWATNSTYDGNMIAMFQPIKGAVMENNIFYFSRYGFICGPGQLSTCLPNWSEQNNAVINSLQLSTDAYIQTLFPGSFVASPGNSPVTWMGSNPEALQDWQLVPGSPYGDGGVRQASDGTDVGVNITTLAAALAGASSPPTPTPTPTPNLATSVGKAKRTGQDLSNQLASTNGSTEASGSNGSEIDQSAMTAIATFVSEIQQAYALLNDNRDVYPAAARIDVALQAAFSAASQANQAATQGDLAGVKSHLREAITYLELSYVLIRYGDVANPIDFASYMVRQQYVDFLNREPDQSGDDFWVNQIARCGTDSHCVEVKRINVSAAFFLSTEFQQTGYYVYRLHKSSYARVPLLQEFLPDNRSIASGVIVGADGWEARLAGNKHAFVQRWVQRADFQARYAGLTNEQYVDTLIANVGVTITATERDDLVQDLVNGASRADALAKLVDNPTFTRGEFNSAFVLMQYFGYLGRDPDSAGFSFWLSKLNQFDGDFVKADMVKAFLDSAEYRHRFGL